MKEIKTLSINIYLYFAIICALGPILFSIITHLSINSLIYTIIAIIGTISFIIYFVKIVKFVL